MLQIQLNDAIQSVKNYPHRLIFIERRYAYEYLGAGSLDRVINVSQSLAAKLLPLSRQERSRKLTLQLERLLTTDASVITLDRIELLFEPSLETSLLSLLKRLSRHKTLIVL